MWPITINRWLSGSWKQLKLFEDENPKFQFCFRLNPGGNVNTHLYIAFSQCERTFTLYVSGSDEHRAPVDLSRTGDRYGRGWVVWAHVSVRLLPVRGRTRAKRGPQREQTQKEEKEERLPPGSVNFCSKFFKDIRPCLHETFVTARNVVAAR